jgi:hypothetical protein
MCYWDIGCMCIYVRPSLILSYDCFGGYSVSYCFHYEVYNLNGFILFSLFLLFLFNFVYLFIYLSIFNLILSTITDYPPFISNGHTSHPVHKNNSHFVCAKLLIILAPLSAHAQSQRSVSWMHDSHLINRS